MEANFQRKQSCDQETGITCRHVLEEENDDEFFKEDDEFDGHRDFEEMALEHFGESKYTHQSLECADDIVTPSNAFSVGQILRNGKKMALNDLPEAPPNPAWSAEGTRNNAASYLWSESMRSSLAFNLNNLQSRGSAPEYSNHEDKPHPTAPLRYSYSIHRSAPRGATSNGSKFNFSTHHSEEPEPRSSQFSRFSFLSNINRQSLFFGQFGSSSTYKGQPSFVSRSGSISTLNRNMSLRKGLSFASISQLQGISRRDPANDVKMRDVQKVEHLNNGAMCDIKKGKYNKQNVILKIPRIGGPVTSANDLEMEIVLLKEIYHQNIVKIYFSGVSDDGIPFMGIEPLMGGTLFDVVNGKNKNLSFEEGLFHALTLANVLVFLHEEAIPGYAIIHRDLKPDNVCFTKNGILKLVDFGLAKVVRRKYRNVSEAYKMTALTGSLRFMAPEVGLSLPYNEKVDVYSWSLVTWFILHRKLPYKELQVSNFQENVFIKRVRPLVSESWPIPLQQIMEDSWSHEYERRPSFRLIVEALDAVLGTSGSGRCCSVS